MLNINFIYFFIIPFLFYIGYKGRQTPVSMFKLLMILSTIAFTYHGTQLFSQIKEGFDPEEEEEEKNDPYCVINCVNDGGNYTDCKYQCWGI
jgi:hypothetical protein